MRMSNKKYFRKLLMSTALTAVPLFFPESAQAVDVDITGIKWVSTLDGGWSDGIVDDRTYVMSSGTTDGTITSIAGFKDQALFGDYTQTYSSGIYQISGGGINIGASNPNQPPTFDFTAGGVIWDASSYSDAFSDNQSATVRMGTLSFTVRNETIGGNIVIGNGIFNGRINEVISKIAN